MAEPRITKTYTCRVLETMEQNGTFRHNVRRFDVQTLTLPPGSDLSPNSPRGVQTGQDVPVAVTTTQAGHDMLDHFGFVEVPAGN